MKASTAGWVFAGPALAVIAVFFALPVLAALALSVTDFDIYAIADLANIRLAGLANYAATFGDWNLFISCCAFLLGAAQLIFLYNMIVSWAFGPPAT